MIENARGESVQVSEEFNRLELRRLNWTISIMLSELVKVFLINQISLIMPYNRTNYLVAN